MFKLSLVVEMLCFGLDVTQLFASLNLFPEGNASFLKTETNHGLFPTELFAQVLRRRADLS